MRRWFASSPPVTWGIRQLRQLLIGALRQGPIPQHVAFVMDGNRRFAKNHKIETVEGHNMGFEALARVRMAISTFPYTRSAPLIGAPDPRSVLQIWRQGRDHIRVQYRELQAVQIRSGCSHGYGEAKVATTI